MRKLAFIAAICLPFAAVGAQSATTAPTYFDFQVDSQVRLVPNTANPKYPDAHKAAKVAGEVLAQFVVDTSGLIDLPTIKFLNKPDSLFAQAVRDELPNMRFVPAYVGSKKVRQLVQLPFRFDLK